MEFKNDEEDELSAPPTPPEIADAAELTTLKLLPEKSKRAYESMYNQFMEWREKKQATSFSERVVLAFFVEISKKRNSTLWSIYSKLRATLSIHHGIRIEKYHKLRFFLRRKATNHSPKKAKTLTPEDVNKFIAEAPDERFLATKVALIMGITGACRRHELSSLQLQNVKDLGTSFLVTMTGSAETSRNFTISGSFYNICKKYLDLRPRHTPTGAFFVNYKDGKCTIQKIGINKFGVMARDVAKFLKLPDSELFTGHCFRKSSPSVVDKTIKKKTVEKNIQTTDLCLVVKDEVMQESECQQIPFNTNNIKNEDLVPVIKVEREQQTFPLEESETNSISATESTNDDFCLFGDHVAAQLRLLPLENALKTQIKIQEILSNERIACSKVNS